MDQDLDQILLLLGGVLGGVFLLVALLAWMEPARTPNELAVRRPAVRVRLATLLGAIARPRPATSTATVTTSTLPLAAGATSTTASAPTLEAGSATLVA